MTRRPVTFTAKGDLDAQGAQEGLSAPQPAGERPGILGPAAAALPIPSLL
jgi:hypothetical protein